MHIFNQEVEYQRTRSKAYARVKHKGVYRRMLATEVLEKLELLGIEIKSERTLQRYVKDELIPMPERKSGGRGKGKITDYQEETPAEFYASHKLRFEHGLKPDFIARCREKGLRMEMENNGLALADWFDEPLPGDEVDANGAVVSKYLYNPRTMQEVGFGQTWLKEKHRILHHGQHEGCLVCQNLNVE